MTNGDKVREMTNSDLMELWSVLEFEGKYKPACATNEALGCQYVKFLCECCPLTFRNWLDAEVDE